MKIELNTAVIIRGRSNCREKMLAYQVNIDNKLCYKSSKIPTKNHSIGTESKGELYALQLVIRRCIESLIKDADITINYVKTNDYAEIYRRQLEYDFKKVTLIESKRFKDIKNNIESLTSRNCTITFKEQDNYNNGLLNFAEEELKKESLTNEYDIINQYLIEQKTSIDTPINDVNSEHNETIVLEKIDIDKCDSKTNDLNNGDVDFVPNFSQVFENLNYTTQYDLDSDINNLKTNLNSFDNKSTSVQSYTQNVKTYKEQITNLEDIYNISNSDKTSFQSINEPSEYLSILSEELNSIKDQCDFYNEEILKLEQEIENTISLRNIEKKECDLLIKEIATLDTTLLETTKFLEDNIHIVSQLDNDIDANNCILQEKFQVLNKIERDIEKIVSVNSSLIEYLRKEIEKATIQKHFLSKL